MKPGALLGALLLAGGCRTASYYTSSGKPLPAVEAEGSLDEYGERIRQLDRELGRQIARQPSEQAMAPEPEPEPEPEQSEGTDAGVDDAGQPADAGSEDEEIMVTGTRLKRTKFTQPSPVQVVTRKELESTGRRTPPCEIAPELRDRICELAARICRIADKHPGDADLQLRCGNARTTCQRATRDVAAACPRD